MSPTRASFHCVFSLFPVASYLVTDYGLIQQMEPCVLAYQPLPPMTNEIYAVREKKDADSVNRNSTARQRGKISPTDLNSENKNREN